MKKSLDDLSLYELRIFAKAVLERIAAFEAAHQVGTESETETKATNQTKRKSNSTKTEMNYKVLAEAPSEGILPRKG